MTRKDPSQPYWLDPETGEGFIVKSARQLHIVKLRVDPGRSWSRAPVKFYLSANNGQNVEVQRFLMIKKNGEITNLARLRRLPSYPWRELDIGEFVVDKEMHVALKYQMMEIEGGQWKSGIIVDCLKIQPSSAIRGVAEGAT
ncbi:hypothetical protein KP509_04G053200 [Ceratopteris richardii]|uniref:Uncharacterized protein n=1 Tax=Ceratopteris richardii TaxID=49495 RepID=A0A8T2UVH2_CERRI|nr:hypothetical protein KP509_04G053200 [Ceratopteris richardii]